MMLFSLDLIIQEMPDGVASSHVRPSPSMGINDIGFYSPDLYQCFPDRLYICDSESELRFDNITDDLNLIFTESISEKAQEKLQKINYLVMPAYSPVELFNEILCIRDRYNKMADRLRELCCRCADYQEIIDCATDFTGMPLVLLSIDYETLGVSRTRDVPEDCLFQAIKQGYGLSYYNYIRQCDIKHEDLIRSGVESKEVYSKIGRNYIHVRLIRNKGIPVAGFGMHKQSDHDTPFSGASVQLFNYVAECLNKRAGTGDDIYARRENPIDSFLVNLICGIIRTRDGVEHQLAQIGNFIEWGNTHLYLIYSKDEECQTVRFIDYLNIIEQTMPGSHGCIYNASILLLCSDADNSSESFQFLQSVLKKYGFSCVRSMELFDWLDLHDAYKMIETIRRSLKLLNTGGKIINAEDYFMEYTINTFCEQHNDNIPLHPVVRTLAECDRRKDNRYVEVLKSYLYHGRSLIAVSNDLHMHRNTVTQKLRRIQELTGMDFDDDLCRSEVYFSIKCHEIQEIRKKFSDEKRRKTTDNDL